MSGQVWGTDASGGYMYSDQLSDVLRMAMQPLMRFRQFCDPEPAVDKHKGETFTWNIYSDVATQGASLNESDAMPETNFTITQGTLTLVERGNSVPFTGILDDLSQHPVEQVIRKVLKNDANKAMETAAHAQFDATLLCYSVTTSTTALTTDVDGTATDTNDVAMANTHVKLIIDAMKERNIPAYDGTNYMCVARPATFRAFKDDLESISQYTDKGFGKILYGEVGRHYEGCRFFEQTHIANESWTNSKSDSAYFFGDDAVVEGVACPEEIRGKIPSDYGRSKGVAWYAVNGFAIVHNNTGATENRIAHWDSGA